MSVDGGSDTDSDSDSDFFVELMRLDSKFFDTNYIEHVEDDKSIKCYKVVPDNDKSNNFDLVHVVRTQYYHPWTGVIEPVELGPQSRLLQTTVIGTVRWASLGAYGNWVPRGETRPAGIKFPTESIFSAKLSIGLDVDEETKGRLQSIEQDIKQELPKSCNNVSIDKWNRILGSGNYLVLKAPLVRYNPNTGMKRKDRSVPLTPESDPFGWFSKYETRNADIGEDSQPRFFEEDAARNRKATNRTEITKGDKLRVLVSFKTYLFSTREGQMVGGVMVIFDEVDVLGRDEKPTKIKLKYVEPGSLPMTPKKKGRYMALPRDIVDLTLED